MGGTTNPVCSSTTTSGIDATFGTHRRGTARHPLQQRLSEQLRDRGFVPVHCSVHARQDDTDRAAVRPDQMGVVAIGLEHNRLTDRQPLQFAGIMPHAPARLSIAELDIQVGPDLRGRT